MFNIIQVFYLRILFLEVHCSLLYNINFFNIPHFTQTWWS